MINFSVNGSELIVNGHTIKFNYPIGKSEEYNNLILVILRFEPGDNESDLIDTFYAISDSGQIVWKMEDVRKLGIFEGSEEAAPLGGFVIHGDKLFAYDWYSRRFTIDPNNGKILELQRGYR